MWSRSVSAGRRTDVGGDDLLARALRVKVQSLAMTLTQSFLRHLPEYGPRDLAGAVWAVGRIGYQPPSDWTSQVLGASLGRLGEFDARQMSCMLWGVAVIKIDPGQQWLDEAMQRAMELAQGEEVTPQSLSLVLWSISTSTEIRRKKTPSRRPDLNFDRDTVSSSVEPYDTGGNPPGEGSPTGGLPEVPEADGLSAWVEDYLAVVRPHIQQLEPRYISMLLSALAKLRHRPDSSTMEIFTSACMLHFRNNDASGDIGSQDQTSIQERWDYEPRHVDDINGSRKQRYGPQGLSNVLWALASLNYRPPAVWCSLCMLESESLLQVMKGQELALTLWSWVLLQVRRGVSQKDKE